MKPEQLQVILRNAGYYCVEDSKGIFHIAEIEESDCVRGIAFKIIKEDSIWLIALYSARTYKCDKTSDISAIALDLLSGKYVAQGSIPYQLPQPFLDKYRIVQAN